MHLLSTLRSIGSRTATWQGAQNLSSYQAFYISNMRWQAHMHPGLVSGVLYIETAVEGAAIHSEALTGKAPAVRCCPVLH